MCMILFNLYLHILNLKKQKQNKIQALFIKVLLVFLPGWLRDCIDTGRIVRIPDR